MKWLARFPLVFCSMRVGRVACHSQADGEAKPVNSAKFNTMKKNHIILEHSSSRLIIKTHFLVQY